MENQTRSAFNYVALLTFVQCLFLRQFFFSLEYLCLGNKNAKIMTKISPQNMHFYLFKMQIQLSLSLPLVEWSTHDSDTHALYRALLTDCHLFSKKKRKSLFLMVFFSKIYRKWHASGIGKLSITGANHKYKAVLPDIQSSFRN